MNKLFPTRYFETLQTDHSKQLRTLATENKNQHRHTWFRTPKLGQQL